MKLMSEFLTKTNLRKKRITFTMILILSSILYSIMFSFVNTIIYMGNLVYYYSALYLFVLWCAFIFMMITFLFLQRKRGIQEALKMKSYILPLLGVQSIFYVVMLLLGVGVFLLNANNAVLVGIASVLSLLVVTLYIPWQLFSFFQIYDGVRNPFKILWNALKTIIVHYRSCFYGAFPLFLIAVIYNIMMSNIFGADAMFSTYTILQEIMITSNPFLDFITYVTTISQNPLALQPAIVSFLYGILLCCVLVYYYMLMLCVYDEEIKV